MKLSIVTTLYESESFILDFYNRISKVARFLVGDGYEIIFVNDGSTDSSLRLGKEIFEKDNKVVIIDLSRNFGHHRALMVGLEYSKGDYIFLIDSDLEEKPEDLKVFFEKIEKDISLDAVYGIQNKRKGKILERFFGGIFYKIFNLLSDQATIPNNSSTIRIMRRKYVTALLSFKDKEVYFAPIANLTGFNQGSLEIKKGDKGRSTYSLSKKYHLFINSIFSYTTKPLYFMFYLGIFITMASSSYILYLSIAYLFYGIKVSGWASTIISIWFFGGMTILFLGIISIYISKIYIESRNRPLFIVKNIWKRDEEIN